MSLQLTATKTPQQVHTGAHRVPWFRGRMIALVTVAIQERSVRHRAPSGLSTPPSCKTLNCTALACKPFQK